MLFLLQTFFFLVLCLYFLKQNLKAAGHHLHKMNASWTREQTMAEYIMFYYATKKTRAMGQNWKKKITDGRNNDSFKKYSFLGAEEPKATGQIEWVSFVCVDRLATDGLYAIRHGCYILVEPRSDEFSTGILTQHTMVYRRMWRRRGWAEGERKERNEYRVFWNTTGEGSLLVQGSSIVRLFLFFPFFTLSLIPRPFTFRCLQIEGSSRGA